MTLTALTQGLNSVSKARLRLGQPLSSTQVVDCVPFSFFKCEEMVVEGGLKNAVIEASLYKLVLNGCHCSGDPIG